MVAAIGSSAFSGNYSPVSPTAGLEAQIAQYQRQLSDCVNCDSANTLQGKETIQAISSKISTAKARVEEINASRTVNQTVRLDNPTLATAKPDNATDAAVNPTANVQKTSTETLGSLVNITV
jgi:hypothetical protein